MIREPPNFAQKQADRMVGRMSLSLPPAFGAELRGVIEKNLSSMPGKATRELADLISAQVALTLRASDFSEVLEKEFSRQRAADQAGVEACDFQRLDMLKRKHAKAVDGFQNIILNRRNDPAAIRAAHNHFLFSIELLDNQESEPLRQWARRIYRKRQNLRGAA